MRTSRLSNDTSRVSAATLSSQQQKRAGARVLRSNRYLSSDVQARVGDIEDIVPPIAKVRQHKRKRSKEDNNSLVSKVATPQTLNMSVKIKDDNTNVSKSRPRNARPQLAKEEVADDKRTKTHPPSNWEQMYALTSEMRKFNPAPVDTMGCEKLAEEGLSERDRRFQTLIALMLSSQTKDTVTALTIRRLQKELPKPGLTLERIIEVKPQLLNEMIWAVGFHNNKTRFIKQTADILRDKFSGDIPDTIEGFLSLPGVGPKMAYLCMSSAWGRDEGIGVDVHVHRITNLWGWHKTKAPEETRAVLESWLPREKWHDINHLLVGFGQTICLPVGRKCGQCTLSQNALCPSTVKERLVASRKLKK